MTEAVVSSYCHKCGKSQPMLNLWPYREAGKLRVETGGFGLTGVCQVCGTGRDFVVSEHTYMSLAAQGKIRYE